jgi:hypothetical protein
MYFRIVDNSEIYLSVAVYFETRNNNCDNLDNNNVIFELNSFIKQSDKIINANYRQAFKKQYKIYEVIRCNKI